MAKPAARILMCRPEHYGIEYEINPWMNQDVQPDHELACQQWSSLRAILKDCGAFITEMEPVKGLPDLVFTANAGLIHEKIAVLSNFRHPQRQGEEKIDKAWLEADGFEVKELPKDCYFEGAGDALFCGDTLFAGYRMRSDAAGHQQVAELIGKRVIPVELVDTYLYHLDTCFCPLSSNAAIYYPDAFDSYAKKALAEYVGELIPVVQREARQFACNAVVLGNHVVTNRGCQQLHQELEDRGFRCHATPLSEFVKAGGSAKCLTLRLN